MLARSVRITFPAILFLCATSPAVAADAPPAAAATATTKAKAKTKTKKTSKGDDKKAEAGKTTADKKAEEKKGDDKKAEASKTTTDKKAEEKKGDDKKAEEKKGDDKKAEAGKTTADKKAEEKKAEEKKPEEKKPEEKKPEEKKVEAPKGGAKYTLVAIPTPDKKIERTWKAKCASCHGNDGKAQTDQGRKMKMDDMTAAAWQTSHGDDELKNATLKGLKLEKDGVKQEMEGYESTLTPEQLGGLLTYVRWLGAPK